MDYSRFESLGDNCEIGFVLRHLGTDEGGLFKWARLKIEHLNAALLGNLTEIFKFENLSPQNATMVHDSKYGIDWHSALKSDFRSGEYVFVDAPDVRKKKHQSEIKKFDYLSKKFIARLRAGGVIYVFKSNNVATDVELAVLHANLTRLATGAKFWLLNVCATADATLWGTVTGGSDAVMTGWIDRFADYGTADDFSAECWRDILNAAFDLAKFNEWDEAKMQVTNELEVDRRQLPFPDGSGSFVRRGQSGDSVVLTSSNEWSRKIGDSFRMHSSRSLMAPASLKWEQIPLAGQAAQLIFSAKLAVAHSLPATVMLRVSADSRLVDFWSSKIGHEGVSCTLAIPKGFDLLSLDLEVVRFVDLNGGEVSVIDIEPIELQLNF